jgi:GNAT superfamily N-acetyltransferase
LGTLTAAHIEELEDYSELSGLIEPRFLPSPDASRCFVYRDDDGRIEGYVFTQIMVVVEPIWVAPKFQKRGVGPRLFGKAVEALKKEGSAQAFYCRAKTAEVEDYLTRLGMKEDGKSFVMLLGR